MPFDKFLIAPFNTGLETDLRPWMIMDDAFTTLQNAYVFRGRVRKRFGSTLMGASPLNSRLRASLASGGAAVGITDVTGAAAGNVRTILGDATLPLAVGQMFSIGSVIYTVISSTPGAQPMLATQGSGTFNISNGDYTITGGPALTTIFFYPGLPVMGIDQYESGTLNNHPTYAWDTRYVYLFSAGAWNRSGTAVWHGNNLNFFWATNWQGNPGTTALFVTNFNASVGAVRPLATDDPVWYTLDGSTWVAVTGANGFYFFPNGGDPQTGAFVQTARIIVPFKNRLLLLSTIENDGSGGAKGTATAYPQRLRYSFEGSPFAQNAWYMENQSDNSGTPILSVWGGAGAIDATTEEQIVSAEFVKDRLIVYFERSTWEVAFTGNESTPFAWQKLNTELGSQSTFSTVPFDKFVLTIGNTGVHACNGSNVERIDAKIPDEIFDFKTENMDTLRTFGIRDYYTELVYWTFLADLEQTTQTYPNQILVYNYKNDSWALNDDCFTAFGYFEQETDTTWASSAPTTWETANGTWESLTLQANQRRILGGTPEGFVLLINPDTARNAPSMQITNMSFAATGIITITIINHNVAGSPTYFPDDEDFLLFENIVADSATMTFLNGAIFPVYSVIDSNTIQINTFGGLTSGTYDGAGTAARVSNIQIQTKQWNPYIDKDRNVYIQRADFGVQRTAFGQITVDYYPSATEVSMIQGGVASGSIMGNNILETSAYNPLYAPLEQYQERLWHPIFFQSDGECIQLIMYMTGAQMVNPNVSLAPFELEGIILCTNPTTQRMQ